MNRLTFFAFLFSYFAIVLQSFTIENSFAENAQDQNVILHKQNDHGPKWVFKIRDFRCLSFVSPEKENSPIQGCKNLINPNHMVFDYSKLMLGGLYILPNPKKVLVIGLGVGTIPSSLEKILPNAKIDIVEIDQQVIDIAKKYFNVFDRRNIKIFKEDGFKFVKNAKAESYDMVFIDAFDQNYIPPSFLTEEFVEYLKKSLSKNGVAIVNTFEDSPSHQLESDLYLKFFGKFFNLTSSGNRIMIISKEKVVSHIGIINQGEKLKDSFKNLNIDYDWLIGKFGFGYMRITLPTNSDFSV